MSNGSPYRRVGGIPYRPRVGPLSEGEATQHARVHVILGPLSLARRPSRRSTSRTEVLIRSRRHHRGAVRQAPCAARARCAPSAPPSSSWWDTSTGTAGSASIRAMRAARARACSTARAHLAVRVHRVEHLAGVGVPDLMHRSAVPPPEASRLAWKGHQASAFTAA